MKEFFCAIVPGTEMGIPCWLLMSGWQDDETFSQDPVEFYLDRHEAEAAMQRMMERIKEDKNS